MGRTKEKILDTAHLLFNKQGVANVSIRGIAAEMGISHGNLIYHFKTKNDILDQLHERILKAALEENQRFQEEVNPITGLIKSSQSGFSILYDYRFFMIDLNYIMRENSVLHEKFKGIETLRATMYQQAISVAIEKGLMRNAEYENEYAHLVERIRIFSDFWISSAAIYSSLKKEEAVHHHVKLFMSIFYPYLSKTGKEALSDYLK